MTKTTQEAKDEFFSARSHEASKTTFDLNKTIAQSCMLINGGAATAVIALLAKDKVDQALLFYVPWGLVGYGLGVLLSAAMLYCTMMQASHLNHYWYYLTPAEFNENASNSALAKFYVWERRMQRYFFAAIACFALSSGVVAFGMSKVAPTAIQTPAVVPPAKT